MQSKEAISLELSDDDCRFRNKLLLLAELAEFWDFLPTFFFYIFKGSEGSPEKLSWI